MLDHGIGWQDHDRYGDARSVSISEVRRFCDACPEVAEWGVHIAVEVMSPCGEVTRWHVTTKQALSFDATFEGVIQSAGQS